jgi:ubiquinone/menaquinone biosynthesis C-methylase UbiE
VGDDPAITVQDLITISNRAPPTHKILNSFAQVESEYAPLTRRITPASPPNQPTVPQVNIFEHEYAYHRPDIKALAELIKIELGESVLDLGTGAGWLLQVLRHIQQGLSGSPRPSRFVGVDGSQSMINLAITKAREESSTYGQFQFVHDNLSTLQRVTGRFDIITCCWAFHHLPPNRRQSALVRWKELLAPGGRIVFDYQGNTPIPCAMDIEHPFMPHATRAFLLEEEDLTALNSAYKELLTSAGLTLGSNSHGKVLGINNHDQALGKDRHFSALGGGYSDHTEWLGDLYEQFRAICRREPTAAEKVRVKEHYMRWAWRQAEKQWAEGEAPSWQLQGSQAPVAALRIKMLSVVGVAKRTGE